MRRFAQFGLAAATALILTALSAALAAEAGATTIGGKWGNAIEVPGSMSLNVGNNAFLFSLSCSAPGNCAAGGFYADRKNRQQAFVVSQRNGHWSRALEVPGTAALNVGNAEVQAVSCAGPGDCTAGGFYSTRANNSHAQAFVVSERNGRWGTATKVPGLAALNKGQYAVADLVSCSSPGNCGVIGPYTNAANQGELFAVSQRNGRWGKATPLRGFGSGHSGINSISCDVAGDCGAAGFGQNGDAFVVSEHDGHWANAIKVPGMTALDTGGASLVNSISCPALGSCTAVGWYATKSGHDEPFVVTRKNGRWGRAFELPQTGALPGSHEATLAFVSCTAVGTCGVGGVDANASGTRQEVFVAGERNGRWGKPTELPGLAALNVGGVALAGSMSCGGPGDCSIGGSYEDGSSNTMAFVASEQNGRWSNAIEVPSLSLLNVGGYSDIGSMSCKAPGRCSAGGMYFDAHGHHQMFVVNQS